MRLFKWQHARVLTKVESVWMLDMEIICKISKLLLISSGFSRMFCGFPVNEALFNMFSFVFFIAVLSFQGEVHFPCGGIWQLHCRLHRCWSKIWNCCDCDANVCRYLLSGKTKTYCHKTATGGIQVLPRMWIWGVNGGISWIKQNKDSQITSLWRETNKTRVLCRATRLNVTKKLLRNIITYNMILWRHKRYAWQGAVTSLQSAVTPPACLALAWRLERNSFEEHQRKTIETVVWTYSTRSIVYT